jgi:hypothetical protein
MPISDRIEFVEDQLSQHREKVRSLEILLESLKNEKLRSCPHPSIIIERTYTAGMHTSEKEYICDQCGMDVGYEAYHERYKRKKTDDKN